MTVTITVSPFFAVEGVTETLPPATLGAETVLDAPVEDEDEDDEDYDDDWFEVECPTCEEPLVIDDKALADGMIQCPNCHDKFALDLSDDTVEADDEE